MERNQFYYTREEGEKTFIDSFNVNRVLRTRTLEDGKVLVLLDDIHERVELVPATNAKGRPNGQYKNQRMTVQSEIILSAEEGDKFMKVTSLTE